MTRTPATHATAPHTIAAIAQSLPDFDFDSSPRAARCERCGAGAEGDLRFVILRGRTRYAGRTLCDTCVEEVLETMVMDVGHSPDT